MTTVLNLRSKLRQELLAYYFLNPAADHYVRELAGILKVDPTNLSKELKRLEAEGLFVTRFRGNQKYFNLNRNYALLKPVRSIVLKTAGMVPVLRKALSDVPGIEEAYLYGSFAKNESDKHSDLDVLIIGDPPPGTLEAVIRRLEHSFNKEINYTLLNRAELRKKLAQSDPFIDDIWRGKKVKLIAA